jgi:hypothetical protein
VPPPDGRLRIDFGNDLRQPETPPISARDQRALDAQLRDIRHNQRDIYRDEQSYQRWR